MSSLFTSARLRFAAIARSRRTLIAGIVAVAVPVLLLAVLVVGTAPALEGVARVPVAVVNLDRGATDAKGRAISSGEDLVDSLQQTDDLAWDVTDEKRADTGLTNGDYALILKIPADYSEKVASLDGDEPEKATVDIVSDGGGNVLATRAGSAALRQVQSRLKSTLGEDYLVGVLNDIRGQATRLMLTSDGAVMLDQGYDALKQGADAISSGLSQTADGAGQLSDGLSQISSGASASSAGAQALAKGISTVQNQAVTPLAEGAGALATGLDQVSAAAQGMGQGVTGIGAALDTLGDTLGAGVASVSDFTTAGTKMSKAGASLAQVLGKASGAAASVGTHAAAISSAVDADALEAARTASDQASGLALALSSPSDGSGMSQQAEGVRADAEAVGEQLDALIAELEGEAGNGAAEGKATGESVPGDSSTFEGRAADRRLVEHLRAIKERLDGVSSGADALAQGLADASSTAEGVSTSAADLSGKLSSVADESDALKASQEQLNSAAGELSGALADVSEAAEESAGATKGVATALVAGQTILKGTDPKTGESHDLAATATALGNGVSQLGAQLSRDGAIGSGASGIASGTQALSQALSPLASGASQIAEGNVALGTALQAVGQGADGLKTGLGAMVTATGQLGSGVDQLKEASGKLTDTMEKAGKTLESVSSDHDMRANVAANPVTFTSTQRNAVEGSAVGFAPAFAAVALWAGTLLVSRMLPALDMRRVMAGRGGESVLAYWGGYVLFTALQAILIGVGLCVLLGIRFANPVALWGSLALGVLAFSAVAQFIRIACGKGAAFVSLALLAVQLLCAGTILPTSLASGPFAVLGAVLPVPALASAVRDAVAGSAMSGGSLAVLVVFALAAIAGSLAIAHMRANVRPERVFAA